MQDLSFGFIGAGRIVRIFLQAMQQLQQFPKKIVMYDPKPEAIQGLQASYAQASILAGSMQDVAAQDVVFIAVHPPQIAPVCEEIAGFVKTTAVVVSLAPVVTSEKLAAQLGTRRLVRMIPTAASFINKGYNPVWFSPGIGEAEKNRLLNIFTIFGDCPLVDEPKLEAYAIVTAMGPTYLWPQLHELGALGKEFGLTDDEVVAGLKAMLQNTIDLLYDSELTYEQVVDLIPVKPLADAEADFRQVYRTKLTGLYKKLKGIQ